MIIWGAYRPRLDPDFAQAVDDCLGPLAAHWVVTFGLRSRLLQAALYAKYKAGTGGEAAPPGRSAHEWGLAIDVALLGPDGKLTWDTETYSEQWNALWVAVIAAPHLHSGHEFEADTHGKVANDDDHIESTKWFAKRAELEAAGTW